MEDFIMKEREEELKINPQNPCVLLGAVLTSAFYSAKVTALLEKRKTSDEKLETELLDRWFTFTAVAEALSKEP